MQDDELPLPLKGTRLEDLEGDLFELEASSFAHRPDGGEETSGDAAGKGPGQKGACRHGFYSTGEGQQCPREGERVAVHCRGPALMLEA